MRGATAALLALLAAAALLLLAVVATVWASRSGAVGSAGEARRLEDEGFEPEPDPETDKWYDMRRGGLAEVEAEPDEAAALFEHAEAFEGGADWSRLLAMGDVYRAGAFPRFAPDEDAAALCYRAAAAGACAEVAGLAQARFVELRASPLAAEDRHGGAAALPRAPCDRACEAAWRAVRAGGGGGARRPRCPGLAAKLRAAERRSAPREPVVVRAPTPSHRLDRQNVHDHGVSTAVRRAVRELEREADSNPGCGASAIREFMRSHPDISPKEVRDAETVLQSIGDAESSLFGTSQRRVLDLAWARIRREPDPALRRDVAESLVKQLASGVERGAVVCSSGKLARIVGAFEGTDMLGAGGARPMWAVREEMAGLAARVRDEFGDDPEGRAAAEFEARASALYVGELGLGAAVVAPIVEALKAGF